ncbi:DEAD/DEAH box helicase family protein [Clostridium perfringens]
MNKFTFYTPEYISGIMSLRKPQQKSLEILNDIFQKIKPTKNIDLKYALEEVKKLYPICSDFERSFISLSYVLATGVGKTRLMGAFITYLYTNHNIRNFFVVAPGNTVYNKLKQDLGNPNNQKYVFKGIGCFKNPPQIITDEDYKNKNICMFESDINIYIYNISKFDKDNVKMRAVNEVLGDSFFDYLSNLDDLVIIMDESHHYHGLKGAKALNDLKPILGLELTATPYYNKGSKQETFKNAVYEYPLSESISDGYTRTPYALTQKNVNFCNFGSEELDKVMINDGIKNHEKIKAELLSYAVNNSVKKIKPFMMVVCKDTEHATKVYNYVTSDEFKDGAYKNKTLLIHSNQSKLKRERNIQYLLDVESYDNLIEIVIHVDMLKEGWDVNNLYTIVPLRTASSKILREQMVGRGLRLPYGKRIGMKYIDAVMLTAHGNFEEILKEAQKEDSIFNAGNVIYAEEIENEESKITQLTINFKDENITKAYEETNIEQSEKNDEFFKKTQELIKRNISAQFLGNINRKFMPSKEKVIDTVLDSIKDDKDLSEVFEVNKIPLVAWLYNKADEVTVTTSKKFIPIPLIQVTEEGVEEYKFIDFDLDLSEFKHVPIKNEIIIQNLEDIQDRDIMEGDYIDFNGHNPSKLILKQLRNKSEIDYEKCSTLIFKLINQVINHYTEKYGENGMRNIVMMNKRDISNKIHKQMMSKEHFYFSRGFINEKVVDVTRNNLATKYNYSVKKSFYEEPEGNISNNLFIGIKKGVFDIAKFDSRPELIFARVIERDDDVKNWLRPNPNEFKIYYNGGRKYEPDFVVETLNNIYLVEVKGEDKLKDPDVIAKKERGIQYCKIATEWGKANGYKEWQYLFIPSQQIYESSSFENLAERFKEL